MPGESYEALQEAYSKRKLKKKKQSAREVMHHTFYTIQVGCHGGPASTVLPFRLGCSQGEVNGC